MYVMWFTNHLLPNVATLLGQRATVNEGWLVGMLGNLLEKDLVDKMTVCCPQNISAKNIIGKTEKFDYVAYPIKSDKEFYDEYLVDVFVEIFIKYKPDIVHIMGTEFPHTYSIMQACERVGNISKTVISIQGLVSIYHKHYCDGLPARVRYIGSFRDMVKCTNVDRERKAMKMRGDYEVRALSMCKHVIGRTMWDKACTGQINSNRTYYHNNEILRPSFYSESWSLEKCEKYTMFVSQATYPVKGFHFVLEAMNLIKEKYPNCKLYVAGTSVLMEKEYWPRWRRKAYENYIFELIQKYKLRSNIVFCGNLSEIQMRDQYLKTHVFVSASTIENSPNSVGEAMILGVPTVSSFVGGVGELLQHKLDGFLYAGNEPYMLADYVCQIFEDDNLANKISVNAKMHAKITHNPMKNAEELSEIYNKILRGV